jgi:hypothetical protein
MSSTGGDAFFGFALCAGVLANLCMRAALLAKRAFSAILKPFSATLLIDNDRAAALNPQCPRRSPWRHHRQAPRHEARSAGHQGGAEPSRFGGAEGGRREEACWLDAIPRGQEGSG